MVLSLESLRSVGLGFVLEDAEPAPILSIKDDSIAHLYGLQVGDCLVSATLLPSYLAPPHMKDKPVSELYLVEHPNLLFRKLPAGEKEFLDEIFLTFERTAKIPDDPQSDDDSDDNDEDELCSCCYGYVRPHSSGSVDSDSPDSSATEFVTTVGCDKCPRSFCVLCLLKVRITSCHTTTSSNPSPSPYYTTQYK